MFVQWEKLWSHSKYRTALGHTKVQWGVLAGSLISRTVPRFRGPINFTRPDNSHFCLGCEPATVQEAQPLGDHHAVEKPTLGTWGNPAEEPHGKHQRQPQSHSCPRATPTSPWEGPQLTTAGRQAALAVS